MRMEFWTDPYTGELFRYRNGDPVEFLPDGIGAGRPGDIVLMAYLFAPHRGPDGPVLAAL